MAALMCVGVGYSAQKKVAFLYVEGYGAGKNSWTGDLASGYTPTADPVYNALAATFDVTALPQADGTEADYEALRKYDCVVLSEAMSGAKTMSNGLVKLVGTVPVVGMKAFNYTSGRWGWAAPSNPSTKTSAIVVETAFKDHALFKGLDANPDGSFTLYDETATLSSNRIQGFAESAIISGAPIETDKLYAKASGSDYICVHEIANAGDYKYVLVSMSSDHAPAINANGQKIIVNAVNYVTNSDPGPEKNLSIAYLYDSSYSGYCGIDNDPIANNTKLAEQDLVTIDVKNFTNPSDSLFQDTLAALQNYDLLVISEALSSGQQFAIACKDLINRVPMLNFKSFIYKKKCWSEGAGANPSDKAANNGGVPFITVPADFREDALFNEIEFESDSIITLFVNYDTATVKKNLVQAYTLNAGSMFEKDDVLAQTSFKEKSFNVIHRHGTKNMYMLISLSSDAMFLEEESNLSESCLQLINNAVDILAKTKAKVTPCAIPTIKTVNGDQVTDVILACATADASIYYTLDGSEPTEASTLYTDTFQITTDSTVVNAIAYKQGFDASAVTSAIIRVYKKPAVPAISIAKEEGKSTVTITAEAGATIYYNFMGSDAVEQSAVYSAPVEITRPMTISAFAYVGAVISDLVSEAVEVQGVDPTTLRENEFARFDANETDWWWETKDGNSKVAYYISKSTALSMYASIDTIIDPQTGDTTYNKHLRDLMVWHPQNDSTGTIDNGWVIFSMGQLIQWENTTPAAVVGKAGDAAYNCDKPEDLLYPATKGHITFQSRYSGEGYNAGILSTQKFQGPFDIVTCVGNNNSDGSAISLALAVSEDGENWVELDTMGVSYYKRFWTTHRTAYNENKEVYIRAMQGGGGTKIAVYDIILFNNKPTAIERTVASDVIATEYFDLRGMRLNAPATGVTIVKYIHADGQTTAEKVIVR